MHRQCMCAGGGVGEGSGREKGRGGWLRYLITWPGCSVARPSSFSDFHLKNIGACDFSENVISKTLLLLHVAAKNFQTCPEFSSQWSSQNYIGIFEILSV